MIRGSEWRRWDLHVHTPASFEHQYKILENEKEKYPGDSGHWEKYIDELEKISDVSVLGVTDYFSIDGYKKIYEYKSQGRLYNFDQILPNIELRLNIIVDKDGQVLYQQKDKPDNFTAQRVNFHIIFSEEIPVDTLDAFLSDIKVKNKHNEERSLNYTNICEIGRTVKNDHPPFADKDDFIVGCTVITIDLDDILKSLANYHSTLHGKYILVLSDAEWSKMGWDGQAHQLKKILFLQSHCLFSSNEGTRSFCLGNKSSSKEDYLNEFLRMKPCIHGSDAHSYEKLCRPDDDRFCWIKANPTFEGLKQILFEPEERVIIQKDNPTPRKPSYTLSSVSISNGKINSKFCIKDFDIPLNQNFIAITGGKGSGKTALIDIMAHCFLDRRKASIGEEKNSFIQRNESEDTNLAIKVEFIDSTLSPLIKTINDDTVCNHARIEYFPQGKIESYCENWEKLNKSIEEIIFSSDSTRNIPEIEKYFEIERKIKECSQNIYQLNGIIAQLEEVTTDQIASDISNRLKLKTVELHDKEQFLKEIEAKVDADKLTHIQQLSTEKDQITQKLTILTQINTQSEEIIDTINIEADSINRSISGLNNLLQLVQKETQISNIDVSLPISALRKLAIDISNEIEHDTQSIHSINLELTPLLNDQEQHSSIRDIIGKIKREITSIEKEKTNYDEAKERLNNQISDRNLKFKEILQYHKSKLELFNDISNIFSLGKDDILNDIDFELIPEFDEEKILDKSKGLFDFRKSLSQDLVNFISEYNKLLVSFLIQNTHESLDLIIQLLNQRIDYQNSIKKSITSLEFYNWLFCDYIDDKISVSFNKTTLDKLSMGQKATVLLKLFLSEGDYPLLLDQPEENLDNRFIFDQMVKAIKKAKTKRQIIIATNNANLVINADAEQIISATFENGIISYKPGAIESSEIRNDILPVLEGGKEAFRLRENKYGNLGIYEQKI
ncbi:hypothetical protein DSECCO2_68150 [anaerobic digester metagenome]